MKSYSSRKNNFLKEKKRNANKIKLIFCYKRSHLQKTSLIQNDNL